MLNLVKAIWSKVKNSKIFWAIIVAIVLFVSGYLIGTHHKIPAKIVEHTVTDQVTIQKLQEALKIQEDLKQQLTVAQQTITDLKTHQIVKLHIVHEKNGTTIEDSTTTTDTDKVVDKTKNTTQSTQQQTTVAENKTVDTQTTTHVDSTKTITPLVKDSFYAGITAKVGTSGIADPGVELKWRPFDIPLLKRPLWIGGEVNTKLEVTLGIGTTF